MPVWTSGFLGNIEGEISNLSDFHHEVERDGLTINSHFNVNNNSLSIDNEASAKFGMAATEIPRESDTVVVEEGIISIEERMETYWRWTKYWLVTVDNPGQFIVVESSKGKFVFDMLEEEYGEDISEMVFDLDSIRNQYPGQWMGGFDERQNNVQKGTLYGNRIEDDTDMGQPFVDSTKKQIGPVIPFDGDRLQARVSRDGFVQIVSPGNYGRQNYLRFVKEVLLDHTV